jgi:pyridinium-3,5-biscarboxylic acid mononucleotide sulfurtransferase
MEPSEEIFAKIRRVEDVLRQASPVLIAYSGGVDSSVLLALAQQANINFLGLIADSPSLPRASLDEALQQAARLQAPVEVLHTQELDDPRYAANPTNRCYFCKAELFQRMEEAARQRGFTSLAYGENADDPPHDRPGSLAAREFSVLAVPPDSANPPSGRSRVN